MIDRNTNNVFTHLGLFEGIGGFSLAARWMGWKTLAWCEWNEFGQKVLKHHFPEAEGFGDITKTDFTKYANKIDILTGGFPCQPYSLAGKRKGKEDERHLWPEMLRAIREVQPRYVVGENVSGLINWNGGLVFNEVQADLEAEGYEVQPFVLPACAVNAPHRRDRIWFVAHAKSARTRKDIGGLRGFGNGCSNGLQNEPLATDTNTTRCEDRPKQHRREPTPDGEGQRCTCGYCIGIDGDVADTKSEGTWEQSSKNRRGEDRRFDNNGETWDAADTDRNDERLLCRQQSKQPLETHALNSNISRQGDASDTRNKGLQGNKRYKQDEGKNFAGGEGAPRTTSQFYRRTDFEQFPTQSPICTRNDGLSARLDNITFSKWRNESIKAAGNAIVPQVAYQIFKSLEAIDSNF
jgi:DNA (cytosine-5)-methyltransferase 1